MEFIIYSDISCVFSFNFFSLSLPLFFLIFQERERERKFKSFLLNVVNFVFFLQKIISFYSGRISKLFAKSKGVVVKNLKVIFNDFPGGSDGFELMTRFCYNNGKININPLNVSLLHCIAHFMEMKESVSSFGTKNLLEQTDKLIEEMKYWTWSELVFALKQCQDLQPVSNGSGILDKYLDAISRRIVVSCETTSPSCLSTASPDSSAHRLSCDTRSTSTESLKNSSSSYLRSSSSSSTWWFEDLVSFDPFLIEMLVKLIYPKNNIDHGTVSKFIFYYQKSRFAATAKPDEKCKIMESVVRMLYSLDTTLVSLRSLFGILRVSLNLNCSKCSRNNLETMIGSQLDQATLDDLLVPSPAGSKYLYDVNLVLRFLKSFIGKGSCCLPLTKLRKVASLMDLYIAEVAPDPCLKPSKFLSLIKALPDSARTSYDAIYQAIDIYFKVVRKSCPLIYAT